MGWICLRPTVMIGLLLRCKRAHSHSAGVLFNSNATALKRVSQAQPNSSPYVPHLGCRSVTCVCDGRRMAAAAELRAAVEGCRAENHSGSSDYGYRTRPLQEFL